MRIQLARIIDEFDRAQIRVHRLSDKLTEAQWSQRTDAARWSVAECVAHLNLTGRAYVPLIRDALEEARGRDEPSRPRYRRDPVGWMLALAMGPVPQIGRFRLGVVNTTAAFTPEWDLPRGQLIAEFDRFQREQRGVVQEAEGCAIDRVWVRSPFDPRLRYNLYSALVILPRHQLRHVVQAERVWQ
jgi:hypothetical protein